MTMVPPLCRGNGYKHGQSDDYGTQALYERVNTNNETVISDDRVRAGPMQRAEKRPECSEPMAEVAMSGGI